MARTAPDEGLNEKLCISQKFSCLLQEDKNQTETNKKPSPLDNVKITPQNLKVGEGG